MNPFRKSGLALVVLLALIAIPASAARLGFEADFKGEQAGMDAKLTEVRVTKVADDSPAQRAGLQPGDVIEQLDGVAVVGRSSREFYKAMSSVKPGGAVVLTVLRAGQRVTLRLVAEKS